VKIGILTFHRAENFGAMLQAYALGEFIKSLGHTVELIDYRNRAIERHYDLCGIRFLFERKNIFASLSVLFTRFFTWRMQVRKKGKYAEFRKNYLPISEKIYLRAEDFGGGYDAYISGSDQVWNPRLTGGLDPVYFLNFAGNRPCKKIAYAASSESYAYEWYDKKRDVLALFLAGFDGISVREESLASKLSGYTSKKIEAVVDPVFLFDKTFYAKIMKDPGVRNYILVYHIKESKNASRIAAQTARAGNKAVIEIHGGFVPFADPKRHKQDLCPLELLGCIFHADMVLTTSFHGMALSLILHKEFYVIDTEGMIRQRNLLEKLRLEDRIVNSADEIGRTPHLDYDAIDERLRPYIHGSKEFLRRHLS
jgi:hypothetical protein